MIPFVAIDPGRNTGWAAVGRDGEISHGWWRLGSSAATTGRCINELTTRLSEIQSRFLPESFVCEDQFIRPGVAVTVRPLLMYQGTVRAHCDRHGLAEPWMQDPSCACKAFGKPHMTKEERMKSALLLGHDVETHDETDALGHLLYRIGILRQMSLGIPGGGLRGKVTR